MSTVSCTSRASRFPAPSRPSRGSAEQGHSLRFVTNNSTRPRATLAEELRSLGFELDDDELQTTPRAAASGARRQAGVRARDGCDRARSRGHRARRRPCRRRAPRRLRRDDRAEPGLLVDEPRPRLRRAADGRRAVLPPQEQVVADEPRPAARRRRLRGGARVCDRRRRDDPRQAERRLLRGRARRARRRARADLDGDRRRRGRRSRRAARSGCGRRSSARASSGPRRSRASGLVPEIVLSSVAQFPDWLERSL